MNNRILTPAEVASNTFRVIIKFPSKKWEDDPNHRLHRDPITGKRINQRMTIGYGEPILFWDDEYTDSRGRSCTTCFTMSEAHGAASWEYFHKDCHTPKTEEEKRLADKLFEWYFAYCKGPPFEGEPLPVRRLKRGRTRHHAAA